MHMQEWPGSSIEAGDFRFRRGEEVLAHLAGACVVPLDSPLAPEQASLPAWTIGAIIARRWRGQPFYLLSFRHQETVYLGWLEEGAIEGTV